VKSQGKEITTVQALCSEWQGLLELGLLSEEGRYRICKLINRTAPVAGKFFLKTLKAREVIAQCAEKTQMVGEHLLAGSDQIYEAMTDLELCYDGLLKMTYQFRIKAG